MFLVLKLILIMLLNITYAYITQVSEIILLPIWNPTNAKEIPLTLKVFGKLIQLNLRKNDQIVSSTFKIWKYNAKGITEKLSQLKASDSCFYQHEDHVSSAVINFCQEDGLEGLIFVENDILEIRPLRNKFAPLSLIDDICIREQVNLSFDKPHLIKKSQQYFADLNLYHWNNLESKRRHIRSTQEKLTIELAIFFDEAAYHTFMPLLDNDKEKIYLMILLYVNCIQAIFHHPSLGVSIDISIVRLYIMEKQPLDLPVDIERSKLLHLFCKYANFGNPPDDNDPRHWDIALYLTGIDLYKYSNVSVDGEYSRNYYVIGTSFTDGLCTPNFSCAIAEFLDNEVTFSGLRSCSSGAHEIAHVLGLLHDVDSIDTKPGDGLKYIMSSPYHTKKRIIEWSQGSRNKIKGLWERKKCLRDSIRSESVDAYVIDNLRYHNLLGREWTAKAQCEVFLRDKDANVVTLHDICRILQCETPHDTYYFAGPALDGTHCALGKECRNGECVPVIEPPYIFKYCEEDNWSEWKEDLCKSSCLIKSKGVLVKRRFCEHQTHRTTNCNGPYYDVILCDDSTLCTKRRKIDHFTTMKCTEFSHILSTLKKGPVLQAPHEVGNPWKACTIFCMQKYSFFYYAPRFEMLYYGIDPYFPDGTWCHKQDGQNYYCRQHHCLPENYSFEEEWSEHYVRHI